MGSSKQGIMVEIPNRVGQNQIPLVQAQFKEAEIRFKDWLAEQSLLVEATALTATYALQGAVLGVSVAAYTGNASLKAQGFVRGPLVIARDFAVLTGAKAGLSCIMKRIRGEEDVQSCMVAAFGAGALFSLVVGSGVGSPGPNIAAKNAIISGISFALLEGGIFQIGHMFSEPPAVDDLYYVNTRSMLHNLGFQKYEKNFKRGLLNDSTLPLLTDSDLKEVEIPPGPRLLILDHIESRDKRKGWRWHWRSRSRSC